MDGEPARSGDRHLQHLTTIRDLQVLLMNCADQSGVSVYEIAHPEGLTANIVDELAKNVHRLLETSA